jgi:hypothetical protein
MLPSQAFETRATRSPTATDDVPLLLHHARSRLTHWTATRPSLVVCLSLLSIRLPRVRRQSRWPPRVLLREPLGTRARVLRVRSGDRRDGHRRHECARDAGWRRQLEAAAGWGGTPELGVTASSTAFYHSSSKSSRMDCHTHSSHTHSPRCSPSFVQTPLSFFPTSALSLRTQSPHPPR